MDYFCYISRTKVDQLYQNISPEDSDEWTEHKTTEHDLGANIGADFSIAKIVNLFKGGITYGRKGVIQRERKIKVHYTQKLRRVLLTIAKEAPIPSLLESLPVAVPSSLFYYYEGPFRIDTPIKNNYDILTSTSNNVRSDTLVTVCANILKYKLLLDCSLRNFSEGNQPDGTFAIHSTNSRFFSGEIDLHLATVFIMLGQRESSIMGTPLFLKLIVQNSGSNIGDYL